MVSVDVKQHWYKFRAQKLCESGGGLPGLPVANSPYGSGKSRPPRRTLPLVESKESSPVDKEEIQIKMDDSVDTSLASEGTYLFVDLWEEQPCLWDPK